MGQKINPIGLRLGINRTWDSRWYAGRHEYGQLLHEDFKIRKFLEKELKQAGVAKIVIERPHKKCRVTIHSARPGVVIGKKGADIEKLRRQIGTMTASEVHLNIVEVRKPDCGGRLGGAEIARTEWYREGRVPLHTLRADIDYGVASAHTAYGVCGVKVWIFKGEILEHDPMAHERRALEGGDISPRRRDAN